MDMKEMVVYIFVVFAILLPLMFNMQVYLGGLVNLESDIDQSQQMQFRRTVILENILNIDYTEEELEQTSELYDTNHRRAIMPIEFFVNEDPPEGELGYQKTDEGNCFIPRVAGLDGENYAYYIKTLYPQDKFAKNPRKLGCTSPPTSVGTEKVFSPALLLRNSKENPRLPVRVYIYSVS
jgi:hypothetical protein